MPRKSLHVGVHSGIIRQGQKVGRGPSTQQLSRDKQDGVCPSRASLLKPTKEAVVCARTWRGPGNIPSECERSRPHTTACQDVVCTQCPGQANLEGPNAARGGWGCSVQDFFREGLKMSGNGL